MIRNIMNDTKQNNVPLISVLATAAELKEDVPNEPQKELYNQ